jgi:hypothetical protein
VKLLNIAQEKSGGYVKRAMSGRHGLPAETEESGAHIAPDGLQPKTPALELLTPRWQKNGIQVKMAI